MKFKELFLLFLLLAGISSASLLEEEWSYHTGAIKELLFEDLDGDGSEEIVTWVGDTVMALNLKGSLLWSSERGNMLSLTISDLDFSGEKELILTSGRSVGGTDRSFLWILNKDGKVILKYPSSRMALTILLKSVGALDLDGNGYEEIIAGTSRGVCAFEDEYGAILWHNKGEIQESIEKIIVEDISGDGKGEILAKAFTKFYLVNYDGGVRWEYSLLDGIKTVNLGDLYPGGHKNIILTSAQEMLILDERGNLTQKVEIPPQIKSIFIENLDHDSHQEIILLAERDLYLLDNDLKLKSDYSFSDEEEIKGIWLENFDLDEEQEIIVFTNKRIYCFWQNLTLKFNFELPCLAHKVFFLPLESGVRILLNSEGVTHAFKINKNIWRKKSGDEWYEKAAYYFNLSFYENATYYLDQTRKIYEEAEYLAGLLKCEDLSQKIENKQRLEKIQLAESRYKRAMLFYNQSNYENATYYLNLARELFLEAKEIGGILRCTHLLREIKELATATTAPSISSTSTSLEEKPSADNSGKLILGGMLLLTILLSIFILRKKKWSKRKLF